MRPFSNRTSRSSSAHSLAANDEPTTSNSEQQVPIEVNVIEQAPSFDWAAASEAEFPLDDDQEEPNLHMEFTKGHPLGKIILGLLTDTVNLTKKSKQNEMESDISDLCNNFYYAMKLINHNTKEQVQNFAKDFEKQMIDKELNSHLVNEQTDPPKHFAPRKTLRTPQQRNEAMRCFPTRNPKFSGVAAREGGVDVLEFISALNTAQEYCNLSEEEFKQFLLLCTTGRAHTLMSEWIRHHLPFTANAF